MSFSGSTRSVAPNVLAPFFKIGDFFYGSWGKVPAFFSDKNSLIGENQKLQEQAEANLAKISDYESIKLENQKLREELKIKPAAGLNGTYVLARAPQIPLDSLLINDGTDRGLKEGDFVLAGDRVLIGKIAKLSQNKSTVTLTSFADSVTYGYVARTQEPIEVKGNGGGSIQSSVPIDFDIEVGDRIMVGSSAPLTVAIIGAVEENTSSGFKKVFMSLPVNVSRINLVFVMPAGQ